MHGYVACIQETIHKYIHSYPCIYCNPCIPSSSACIFVHTSHADMSCIPEWIQASWPHAYLHGCNACIHAYTHVYSDAHTHSYVCIPKQIPPNFIHTMLTYYLPCPPSPLRRRCRRCWCRPRLSVMPASSRPLPSLFPTCLHSHEYRRGPNFGIQALR